MRAEPAQGETAYEKSLVANVFGFAYFCILVSSAHAAKYTTSNALGKVIPMWMELSATVNNTGDVAWAQFSNATPPVATAQISWTRPCLFCDERFTVGNMPWTSSKYKDPVVEM